MRILLTGGAGFIGSHLCDSLLERGHEVICMDNLITGSKKNIEHNLNNKKFTFIDHNVCDFIEIDGDIDFVLHFASPASPIDYMRYPIQTLKVGSLGTHKTLGVAKAKAAKYLLASTSEVYGDPLETPQKESYWGNVNPVGPRGVYDESKRFAEAMVMAYRKEHGIDTRIARIFNTYGPRMRMDDGRVVPNFVSQAINCKPLAVYGDGMQTRSFCYISDLIDGVIKLMESDLHEPVNLGNPEEISINDFAKRVIKATSSKSKLEVKPLPEDDPKRRKPDIGRAKKELKWSPKVSLDEGLKKTVDWFRNK